MSWDFASRSNKRRSWGYDAIDLQHILVVDPRQGDLMLA
ncbi:hypothetical protein GWE_00725 [Chlamydia psittaci NJ1]|nr:hypothetical protein B712_0466 [Chlamydia psittaci NJ1]KPZ38173.1 hypothetical protein GWE_00725 [Chlamydia psittaci NJ1]